MNVITYFIEANIGLVLLYLLYKLLLEHETQFSFLRSLLLVGIVGSLLIPLVKITDKNLVFEMILLPEITVGFINQMELKTSASFDLMDKLMLIYCSGAFIFSSVLIFRLSKLIFFLARSKYIVSQGLKVIEINGSFSTFSFFNYVIIGNAENLSSLEKDQIILHESAHLKLLHRVDLFMLEFLKTLFWFNPAVYLLKNKLITIHEFQADEITASNYDSKQYCNLLAKVALMSADIPLANHFSNSLTLKRINMIKTMKTKIKTWKIVAMLPVFTCFILTAIAQEKDKPQSEVKFVESKSVDDMATYVGGIDAMSAFLSKNIKYPEKARNAKTVGKVFVKFLISTEGSVSQPTIIKGVSEEIDQEALRVVSLFPKWNPAKHKGEKVDVEFVLPINFQL